MSCGLTILSLTVVVWCFVASVSGDVLPVYHQELTTSKYLYQSTLPAMSELTTCFWLNMDNDRGGDYVVSVATQDDHYEFLIGWDENGDLLVYVQGQCSRLPICCGDMSQLFTGWHRHCFTWKAGGQIKWYADRDISGQMQLIMSVNAPSSSYTVRDGGFLVLMQLQNSLNGSISSNQTLAGKLAEFNMWNYEMSSEEIGTNHCGCKLKGSVVSWDMLQEQGVSIRSHYEFPNCNATSMVYHQEYTISKYLYQSGLPAMSELTTCFWLRIMDGHYTSFDYLFTLAHSDQERELKVRIYGSTRLFVYIQGRGTWLDLLGDNTVTDLFTGWHKHCLTWKADGEWKWYTDRYVAGSMTLVASAAASSRTIRSGGFLALLQDQSGVDEGYSLHRMIPGQIAEFNMWNHEMPVEQLNNATCGISGTVASWDTLRERGNSERSYLLFPDCIVGRSVVYNQEHTTSKYLYQSGLPAMSQSTTCFWLEMKDDDDRTDDWFVSYVISDLLRGHEFLFGFGTTDTLTVYVQGGGTILTWLGGITVADLFTGWHKHCLTWRAGGQLKWYTDRQVEGRMELVASAAASGNTIRGGGTLALLHEQHGIGNPIIFSQSIPGQIAEFNMWQHEMTLAELNSNTCGDSGTVSSLSTLQEYGESARSYRVFPACTA